MSELTALHAGAILSADIAVPEHDRELEFYSSVLSTGDPPLWRENLMNSMGIPIIGLGERSGDNVNLPVQWMPHIQVPEVSASVERAAGLGGKVLLQSGAGFGGGEWAVLLDPVGAAFEIITVVAGSSPAQPDASGPQDPAPPAGRIGWVDLTVPNASALRDFYRHVVGWSAQDVAMKGESGQYADYNMLDATGTPAAGICHARGVNADLPPVWLIYLPVGDLGESIRRTEGNGGKVVRSVRDAHGKPQYAVIQDPVGVFLALAAEP